MTIGKLASDGRPICIGNRVGVGRFVNGYYFTVLVEGVDKFRLLSDYDISPDNPLWNDYELPENVLGRDSSELVILE